MRATETAEQVILEPDVPARAAVIWLHGLGADGHDFVPIVGELGLPDTAAVRFVFPHAPVRPVTINGGMPMRAWYDILTLGDFRRQDAAGVVDSARRVRALIEAQADDDIAPERIVVAGFSQGGAIALHTALRHDQRLAGVLALSTYLPLHDTLAAEAASVNRATPILMCHGSYDNVLPATLGEFSCRELRALGYTVDWRSYPMQHQVCMEEIEDIGAWLTRVLALEAR